MSRRTLQKKAARKHVYERDGGKCFYCEAAVSFNEATLDHIVPRSKGGPNAQENLVTCCYDCNVEKQTMDAAAFLKAKLHTSFQTPKGN